MFILIGWRKNGDTKIIAVNKDRKILDALRESLNKEANYTPGEGIWDKNETKGVFRVEELKDDIDANQTGIDFINCKDLWK